LPIQPNNEGSKPDTEEVYTSVFSKIAGLGNKTRYLIIGKFFTIKNLQQLSCKYSKNVVITDRYFCNQNVKLFNNL